MVTLSNEQHHTDDFHLRLFVFSDWISRFYRLYLSVFWILRISRNPPVGCTTFSEVFVGKVAVKEYAMEALVIATLLWRKEMIGETL